MPAAAPFLAACMATSLVAWSVIAHVHVVPLLARRPRREALMVLVTPHMFRHVGAMAAYPGISGAPSAWSVPLAWGDGATALLAVAAMVALHGVWRHAIAVTWLFNVFGTLDMLHNGFNAVALRVAPDLGVAAFAVAFLVPGMFVCHLLVFRALLRADDVASPRGRP